MHANARLRVDRDASGRSVVRELRSEPPLSLLPQRGAAAARSSSATVHMIGSATTPLGGDDVTLDVEVAPGASLVLTGVAAAVALPGPAATASRFSVRLLVGAGARVQYLPEPTVVTLRAEHYAELHAELGPDARLRCREVIVAGRSGEASGHFVGRTRVQDAATGRPLLVQAQELGDPVLQDAAAHLAGRRVLGTEVLVWGADPVDAATGAWWSLTPLVDRGALATAVGDDAVSTARGLAEAIAAHPGWAGADHAAGRSW